MGARGAPPTHQELQQHPQRWQGGRPTQTGHAPVVDFLLPLNRVAAARKLLTRSWCYSVRKNDKVVIVLRAGNWNPTPAADAAGCAGTASTPESPAAVDIKACVAHAMSAVHENLNSKRLNKYMGGAGQPGTC